MSPNQYIPAGRTSLINRGSASLQVQTEYAFRPYPRVTTTILDNGKVLHKVEKKLKKGIDTLEEQSHMEEVIKNQHSEILSIIKEEKQTKEAKAEKAKKIDTTSTQKFKIPDEPTLADKFNAIPGVEKVYHLDRGGNFVQSEEVSDFKSAYPSLYRGLEELVEMFMLLPGAEMKRERGVYELERDTLYFVSAGRDFYFLQVKRIDHQTDFEASIKELVTPDPYI